MVWQLVRKFHNRGDIMSFIQVLSCSGALGTCCNEPALVGVIDTFRRIMDLIQIVVPIMLLIRASYGFIRLMSNPEEKNGIKTIVNKFLAAAIVFFVPTIVNAVLGIMPDSFSISACWQQAKVSSEIRRTTTSYVSPYDSDGEARSILVDSDEYEKGEKKGNRNGTPSGGNGQGSATGNAIVQYAKSFVGKPYVWGGTWNGEQPYTGTVCSGFVQGVFHHFRINLSRTTASQWADKSKYTVVSDIRPGDLIMYDGHVGILTGNGNEIVHAKGSKWGVVVDPDYRHCSSHAILGIMRINGVN